MNTYTKLANFGRELLQYKSIAKGIPLISTYAKELSGASRCSIYIYNHEQKTLWTTLSDGIEKITLKENEGIAGQVAREAKAVIENTPYKNPNFDQKIDQESGFITKNIAAIPILDSSKKVIGVLQLLNKEDGFNEKDIKTMTFFAHYISGFLELSNLFNEEN